MNSPWIDFLCAPAGYYRRGVGEPGGEQVCAQSITRRKLFLDELDLRTHLAQESPRAANWTETRYLLWREFSKCLMYHNNFWWMDLGGGWFDSPEIVAEIGRLEQLARRLRQRSETRSPAQVLVLSSDEAFLYHRPSFDLQHDLMQETLTELQLCAVTVDHYRTSDLKSLELGRYQLVVVLNSFEPDSDVLEILDGKLAPGAPVLLMYASEAVYGADSSGLPLKPFVPPSEFGIKFGELPERRFRLEEHEYPLFRIDVSDSEGVTILARYSDGTPVAAECRRHNRTVIRFAVPLFSKWEFREILRRAGVRPVRDGFAACYGDERFLAVFADGDSAFDFSEKQPSGLSAEAATSGM